MAPRSKSSTSCSSDPGSSLIGNFAQICCPDTEIIETILAFESAEQLQELRDEHRSTHLLRREGDSIRCISLAGKEPSIAGNTYTINLQQEPGWVAGLCRSALIGFYTRKDREILNFDPLEVVRKGDGLNLLPQIISEPMPNWLTIKKVCEIQCRVIYPDGTPSLVIVVNSFIRKRFHATCEHLRKQGLDVTGLSVGTLHP